MRIAFHAETPAEIRGFSKCICAKCSKTQKFHCTYAWILWWSLWVTSFWLLKKADFVRMERSLTEPIGASYVWFSGGAHSNAAQWWGCFNFQCIDAAFDVLLHCICLSNAREADVSCKEAICAHYISAKLCRAFNMGNFHDRQTNNERLFVTQIAPQGLEKILLHETVLVLPERSGNWIALLTVL